MILKKLDLKTAREKMVRLIKFYRLIWSASPSLTLINVSLRLYSAIVPFFALYIGRTVINNIILITAHHSRSIRTTVYLIIAEFVIMTLRNMAEKEIILNNIILSDIFSIKTNIKIMEHSKKLELSFFENVHNQNIVDRAIAQASNGPALLNSMLDQAQQVITILSLIIGIFTLNGWYLIFLLAPAFLSWQNENRFYEKKYSLMLGWSLEKRAINYYRSTLTLYNSLREVKVLDLYDFFINRFKTLSDDLFVANKQNAVKRALWSKIYASIHTIANYSIYIYMVVKTVRGELSIGDLTFLIGAFEATGRALQRIFEKAADINEQTLNLTDFFKFFSISNEPDAPKPFVHFPERMDGITFNNVSFKYSESGNWVLRNLSFSIRAGEKWGLMGENGSGKSTIVKLLLRFHEPTEGQILLNGIKINEYTLDSYYKNIGVHYQDYCRYYMETGLNIGIGNKMFIDDQTKIEEAAAMSKADKIIENLPNKYDQMLGNYVSEGVELSGGQWQKIALSRVFMKDYQVLILDEPFAAIDFLSEVSICKNLMKVSKDKILVLISHKLSTLRTMDKIIVLENGQIAESGTHSELMETQGRYYHLFNLQTQSYN